MSSGFSDVELGKLDHPIIRFLRRSEMFNLSVPRTAEIADLRWGVFDRALKLALIGYLVSTAFYGSTPAYEPTYPTTGFFTELWFDESSMVDRVATDSASSFCTAPYAFNYEFCNHSAAFGYRNEFWCEDQISCQAHDPSGTMFKQTPNDVWVVTYLKKRSARTVNCSSITPPCDAEEVSQRFGDRCQCVRTRNSFVPGAEGATVNFRHKPSWAIDASTSSLPSLPSVSTTIQVKPLSGSVPVELDPAVTNAASGGTIRLPLTALLDAAGIESLDDTNELVQSDYPSSSGNPSYRITGLAMDIRVNYEGSITSERGVRAVVLIEPQQGWIHAGNALSYDDDSLLTASTGGDGASSGSNAGGATATPDAYNVYRRGVHLSFSFAGSVSRFEAYFFLQYLATFVVFLSVGSTVTNMIVMWLLGYTSKVYRNVVREHASIRKVHGQMSAQALVAAAAFEHFAGSQSSAAAAADTGDGAEGAAVAAGGGSAAEAATKDKQWQTTLIERLSANGMLNEADAAAIALHASPFGSLTATDLINNSASVADRIPIALMAKHTKRVQKRRRSTWGVANPVPRGMSTYFGSGRLPRSTQVEPSPDAAMDGGEAAPGVMANVTPPKLPPADLLPLPPGLGPSMREKSEPRGVDV